MEWNVGRVSRPVHTRPATGLETHPTIRDPALIEKSLFAFGSMISLFGSAEDSWKGIIRGMVSVVFGMALGGWVGNVSEISELKQRVSTLEQQASERPLP